MGADFVVSPAAAPTHVLTSAPAARRGPIIVATDGSPDADAAFRAAKRLAGRLGTDVQVLSVVDTVLMPMMEPGLYPDPARLNDARCTERRSLVLDQLRRLLGDETGWPVEVRTGVPERDIARTAAERDASLVVTGLGRHRLVDRIAGTETALQLLRLGDVPVLAVPADFLQPPHRAVIGVDFSAHGFHAARTAAALLGDGATVYLAHVMPAVGMVAPDDDWAERTREKVAGWLERLVPALDLPPGATVEPVVLRGHPARALLDFAAASKADLIVAGSHGHGFFERLVLGSVCTRILRAADCAVLVVPPAPSASRPAPADRGVEVRRWAQRLREFTARNAGRRCTLEVDDPDAGAQVQARDYPFLGADLDRGDCRVEIVLGDTFVGGRHLVRNIAQVSAVDLAVDPLGTEVLRVAHGGGQTLVTIPARGAPVAPGA